MAKFETRFGCGEKGWTFDGADVVQRTVGQVRIEYTNSAGNGDNFRLGQVVTNGGENYEPIAEQYREIYMCVETGIGSGTLYTLGETFFGTREECEVACAEAIQRRADELASRKAYERRQALSEEAGLRMRLARIEQLKAESA